MAATFFRGLIAPRASVPGGLTPAEARAVQAQAAEAARARAFLDADPGRPGSASGTEIHPPPRLHPGRAAAPPSTAD
ncbi:hypothetical protein [Methylobacterium sp. JK268]